MVYSRFVEHGIDCYVGMFGMDRGAIVMVADLIYNKHDQEMTERVNCLGAWRVWSVLTDCGSFDSANLETRRSGLTAELA